MTNRVWVIDDDRSIRWVLEKALTNARMDVTTFDNADAAIAALNRRIPDAILTDIRMPGTDGLALLERLGKEHPDLPVVIMTAHSDLDAAVAAYQGGAFEYLPKPFDVDEAVAVVERACEANRAPTDPVETHSNALSEIIGEAPAMQEVFRAIGRLSRSNITVLINGESGTGKELVARALHRHSPRAGKPFIALNMAAIPKDLMESELFGHERGAFTGAQSARAGRFEQAHGGTLFLDEIGDMPIELQTRLLRVLADGEFFRVGAHDATRVDVRIIAATHQNLEKRVQEGSFREDLFHRLNVIRVHLPSLRERREDIPLLAAKFLERAAKELEVEAKLLGKDAGEWLSRFDWPGNVRQLENTCRWLTVMATGREVHVDDLPREIREPGTAGDERGEGGGGDWKTGLRQWARARLAAGEAGLVTDAVESAERILIEVALQQTGGRRQDAAKLLGWGRNTLTRKIKELGMEAEDAA
ncbi:MAG: nitrogen regulation protein NR(I) [Gammaproteobacteria bacterium]|nr:nitrogen regulation protein NR(I) [Gammaproteobacteria bacterium]